MIIDTFRKTINDLKLNKRMKLKEKLNFINFSFQPNILLKRIIDIFGFIHLYFNLFNHYTDVLSKCYFVRRNVFSILTFSMVLDITVFVSIAFLYFHR